MQHDTIEGKIDMTTFVMAQIYAIGIFLSKANV
jgi:hypothetical protein